MEERGEAAEESPLSQPGRITVITVLCSYHLYRAVIIRVCQCVIFLFVKFLHSQCICSSLKSNNPVVLLVSSGLWLHLHQCVWAEGSSGPVHQGEFLLFQTDDDPTHHDAP